MRLGDTGSYTYEQAFDWDPGVAGSEFTLRVTENVPVDPVDNGAATEMNRDHVGDTQSFGPNINFGPYRTTNAFGGAPGVDKVKIVYRDYSNNRLADGSVRVQFDFSAYPQGVENVSIRLHDVDWRGAYNSGSNDEQDRVFNLVVTGLDGTEFPVTAVYQPWAHAGSGQPGRNSYIIFDNGTLGMQIIARNADADPFIPTPNPTTTLTPSTVGMLGFVSTDSEGWGDLVLQTPVGVAVRSVAYSWSANANNLDPRNPQAGWGHEIGLVTFSPIPEPAALAAFLAAGALVVALRRRR